MPRTAAGRIPQVDAYIAKAAPFAQPILIHLRDVVHQGAPAVEEQMKWSRPFFVYEGVILGNISAFKAHCSFGLWGTEIAQKLRADGVASSEGMGTFGKITSLADLPSRSKLVAYVKSAANQIATGKRTKAWSRPRVAKPEPEVPAELAAVLKQHKVAGIKFAALTPGCRREYCNWIAGAKREETRMKRAATAVPWIAKGKSLNWKYETSA
jgi:uncharacterized protein YdeI (YjbR/CyaY-like superfamily)